jgi:hypothetical protein
MTRFLKKYSRECKAGGLLFLVYTLHLFTYHALLSNPDAFLSRQSFSDYKTDPHASANCLLLLAKKNVTKHTITFLPDLEITAASISILIYPKRIIRVSGAHLFSDSWFANKLYLFIRVLLV